MTLGIDGLDGDSGRVPEVGRDALMGFDQVIVGTNNTRWRVVRSIREMHGRPEGTPVRGDRIMGVREQPHHERLQRSQLTVKSCGPDKRHADRYAVVATDDEGHDRKLRVWATGFVAYRKLFRRDPLPMA